MAGMEFGLRNDSKSLIPCTYLFFALAFSDESRDSTRFGRVPSQAMLHEGVYNVEPASRAHVTTVKHVGLCNLLVQHHIPLFTDADADIGAFLSKAKIACPSFPSFNPLPNLNLALSLFILLNAVSNCISITVVN
jgi:hypothetical protein